MLDSSYFTVDPPEVVCVATACVCIISNAGIVDKSHKRILQTQYTYTPKFEVHFPTVTSRIHAAIHYLKLTYGCIYLFTFLSSLTLSTQCSAIRSTLSEISYPRSLSTLYSNATHVQRLVLFVVHDHLSKLFKRVSDIDELVANLTDSGNWSISEFDMYQCLITRTLLPSRKLSRVPVSSQCKIMFGNIHTTCSKYDRTCALLWLIAENDVLLPNIKHIYFLFGIKPVDQLSDT